MRGLPLEPGSTLQDITDYVAPQGFLGIEFHVRAQRRRQACRLRFVANADLVHASEGRDHLGAIMRR